ncbi:MAG: GldG family protein [Mariprofundales bacterium]
MSATNSDNAFRDGRGAIRRHAWLMLTLVLLATAALYAAAWTAHVRWDWSDGKVYSLSNSTRTILKQLKEPVRIRAYVTQGLPQPYGSLRRFIGDMLASYHDAAPDVVSYDILDPASDPNVAASLAAMGIPRLQVQAIEDDQARIKQGYMAIVIEHLDKKETIPVVQSEVGFEYNLSRKIKRVTATGQATIGVVGDFGATEIDHLQRLRQLAGDDYKLVAIHPDKAPIADDVAAVVIAGMRQPPSALLRYRIDQLRMGGKGILVLAGNAVPQLNLGFQVQAVDPYSNDWLREDLGVVIRSGLVLDRDASRVMVNQRQGQFMFRSAVDYPFMPAVHDLNDQQLVTHGLTQVAMPFASPVGCVETEGCSPLMRSSARSTLQHGPPYDVDPMRSPASRFTGMQQQPHTLAVVRSGSAGAAFAKAPQGLTEQEMTQPPLKKVAQQRLIVIGAPALLDDTFLDGDNTLFVLNTLDWLSGNSELIALRSRGVQERPLMKLDSQARTLWKGLWMFGLPLLIALLAVLRWKRRLHSGTAR